MNKDSHPALQTSINLLSLRCRPNANSQQLIANLNSSCGAIIPPPTMSASCCLLCPPDETCFYVGGRYSLAAFCDYELIAVRPDLPIRGVPYLTFKLPCPEPIAFTASLRLYCFMRRCRGSLSDAGTPYRPAPKTVYAEKLFGAGLHGFDTALRALTLDYARLSTNLRSIRNSLDFSALAESNPPAVGPHKSNTSPPRILQRSHSVRPSLQYI